MPVTIQRQAEAVEFVVEVAAGPNTTQIVNHGGSFVRVRSSNRSFQMRLGTRAPFTLLPGSEYHAPEGEFFPFLTIVNPTTDALSVTLIVGQGNISSESSPQLPWPQLFLADAATSIGAGVALAFPGTPTGTLVQRKSIAVSNLDPSLTLYFRDSPGGNLGRAILAGQTIQVEASGPIDVFNPNGSAVAVAIGEEWLYNP